jgi:hypothetical protein
MSPLLGHRPSLSINHKENFILTLSTIKYRNFLFANIGARHSIKY